jgi:hypothetical protein
VSVSDTIRVPLPPERAFELFTPLGERRWASGWEPRFLVPTDDGSQPGTAFEVGHGGHTATWVLVRREPARLIEYAWVVPGQRAAVVSVACAPDGPGSTVATVTYHVTALTPEQTAEVERFAGGYRRFLDHWQAAIAAAAAG